MCPGVPWVALTATANAKAQDDIAFQLKLRNPESFKSGTYRDNLFYDVAMRDHLATAPEVLFRREILRFLPQKYCALSRHEKG